MSGGIIWFYGCDQVTKIITMNFSFLYLYFYMPLLHVSNSFSSIDSTCCTDQHCSEQRPDKINEDVMEFI